MPIEGLPHLYDERSCPWEVALAAALNSEMVLAL
jgi:hypothetical protein